MVGARRQTLAHKQRMPTSQGGADKCAFCPPYDGHFVDNKQSHCSPVVRSSSQFENTAHVSREEFARDVSDSNNLCDHVHQVENALTKMIQSLTGVVANSRVKLMVCHAVMTLKASKFARICHMFLFRLLKVKIMSKSSPVKTLLKMLMSTLIQLTLLFARTKCI